MWWHVAFVLCFPHPSYQVYIIISKQWLSPKCWHNVRLCRPHGRLMGCLYTRGLNRSSFRIRGGSHAASPLPGSLLHLPTLPQPPSYPPPNLGNCRPASTSSQGAGSCPLFTQLELTFGTLVSRIPHLLEQLTEPAGAASLACMTPRCPFSQSMFLKTSEEHNTPPSFIQQR